MARTRRAIASRFIKKFESERPTHELAAQQAIELIEEILINSPALVHLITARCKETSSLWLKLCDKRYGQPGRQLTDIIAARVITYYTDDVPVIVKALSDALEINPYKSADKRDELESVEFGYTSVHLIARTQASWRTSPKYFALRNKWFEIQVRSILEHAWAEIEHEVVYKSGIDYPPLIRRRFARIAGAIEMLEGEFVALRDHQEQLVEIWKGRYESRQYGAAGIDSVRLMAMLECERPDSLGWRDAARQGTPFPPHIARRCVKALERTGIRTGQALRTALRSKSLKDAEKSFAQEDRISEPVSHLSTARLVVLLASRAIFADYFPEMMSDPGIRRISEQRRGGRRR
jgi:ppGpp synthetase/RelA/SpoT-type nucleotidyltranferase